MKKMKEIGRLFEELNLKEAMSQFAKIFTENFMISGEETEDLEEVLKRAPETLLDMILETWDEEAEADIGRAEKEKLVQKVIIESFEQEFIYLDKIDFEILLKTMNNYPISEMEQMALTENYVKKGWVFMFCPNKNEMSFVVTNPIREMLTTGLQDEEKQILIGFITGVRITINACINLYGVIEKEKLIEIARKSTFKEDTWSEEEKTLSWVSEKLEETIEFLAEREGSFWLDKEYIVSADLEDRKDYRQLLRQVSGKAYYMPNVEDINRYSENLIDRDNVYYKRVLSDLERLMGNKQLADNLLFEIEFKVVEEDMNYADILNLLYAYYVDFPTKARAESFVKNLKKWIYTVKKWSNRGFSDKELGKRDDTEEMFGFPIPMMLEKKKVKIGRNDPCPCGSGKKFKKCCSGNGKYD